MRVLVVDDDKLVAVSLKTILEADGEITVVGLGEAGDDAIRLYREQHPDILLMDIEMAQLNGMETARRIRKFDEEVLIVFITNTAQYAIKGYEVGALDYILKPIPYFSFSQQLRKAELQLQKRKTFNLTLLAEGGMHRLNTATIYYIESDGHTVHFYTQEGSITASGLLKSYEEKLAGHSFARCSNCYLVNLAHVSGIAQDTVKVGPYQLPVSRTKRHGFLDAMSSYIDSSIFA